MTKEKTHEEQNIIVTAEAMPDVTDDDHVTTAPETPEAKVSSAVQSDARREPFEKLLRHLTTDRNHEAMLEIVAAELAK